MVWNHVAGSRITSRWALAGLAAVVVGASAAAPAGAAASAPAAIRVPSLDSAPIGLGAGPGGTMWFVENTGFAVGRIDSAGHVTEFAVPANSAGLHGSLNSITSGPDSAMWFTDESSSVPRVGRVDPSTGAVTMFELPARAFAGAQPMQITAGPDGALWFTTNSATVGRVDLHGVFTRYRSPVGGSTRGITVGPDGAIWFTEVSNDAVVRLDPVTGAMTAHHVSSPLGTAAPVGIASGPDGALWFTDSGTSSVGRLDPATGHVSTIKTPTHGAVPTGIISGPDGSVWFTEAAAGNVARLDPATRTIREFPLSNALDAPMRLALGADGRVWISETGADLIALVDPLSPPSGAAHAPVAPNIVAPPFASKCPASQLCITQVNTGGSLRIKTFTQQLPPGAIRLTGYPSFPANPDGSFTFNPPLHGEELQSQPVPVPGGLLGTFPLLGPIVGPLVGPANDLSVTLSLAGPVSLTLTPLGATVPVTLHLHNPLLGNSCTIGPVVQHLLMTPTAAGQSDPPMSWAPVPVDAADDTFSVPGAQGCGALPLVFDPVINTQLGLPSASGNNAVFLPAVLSEGIGVHP